jgi:hypothetical protein
MQKKHKDRFSLPFLLAIFGDGKSAGKLVCITVPSKLKELGHDQVMKHAFQKIVSWAKTTYYQQTSCKGRSHER